MEEVPYQLQLPPGSQTHGVIHVSKLKKHVPPRAIVEKQDFSLEPHKDLSVLQLASVVHTRLVQRGGRVAPRLRIRWQGRPATRDT